MKNYTKIFVGLVAIITFVSYFPQVQSHSNTIDTTKVNSVVQNAVETLTQPKTAQAAPAAPASMIVEVIDNDNNISTCTGGQYGSRTINFPQTPGSASGDVTDAPSSKDINCAKLSIDQGAITNPVPLNQSMYTLDFRLGIEAWEAHDNSTVCNDNDPPHGPTGWTRWASEGEGPSLGHSFLNGEEVDCLRVFVETRPLTPGTFIKDVRMAIGTGSQTQWTPWFTSGQGLTTGYAGSGDTSIVRIGLDTDLEYKLDADHISDTVPRTAGSFTVGTTGNYTVDMKNIGGPWFSDEDLSSSITTCSGPEPDDSDPSCQQNSVASCDSWQPLSINDTCTDNRVVSSNRFKLKRIDNNTGVVTTPTYLKYQRDVQYTWSAYEEMEKICEDDPNDPGDIEILTQNKSWLEKLGLVKPAQARDINPGQICHFEPTGNIIKLGPFTNQSRDIYNGTTATFDLPITPQQDGSWELLFQMERDGVELFGNPEHAQPPLTIVHIAIIVGDAMPWTFNCTATQTVPQGTDALYSVGAVVPQSYTNTIVVTMNPSNPAGATMSNAPLALSPSNVPLPYQDVAVVPTSSLSPGNYILYFKATEGPNTAICQAQLIVSQSLIGVDLKFNMSDGPLTLPTNTSSGELSWTTENAASCTANMVSGNILAWVGNKPTANVSDGGRKYEIVSGFAPGATYEFRLTCQNQFGVQASDNVTINLTGQSVPAATADLFCTGAGDINPQNGPCTVPSDSAAYLSWETTNATQGCTLLPDFGAIDPDDTASYSTGQLTAPPSSRTYTLTCKGPAGTPDAVDTVLINITTGETPNTPILSATNIPCGSITLNWTIAPPSDTTTFRVFHSTGSENGPWTEITDSNPRPLPVGTTSFVHDSTKTPPPATTNNYYRVVAYNGSTPSVDDVNKNIAGPINLIVCQPNMNLSDKDIISVGTITDPDSIYTNPASQPCNGQHDIIPERKVFKHGDAITYRINICNNGDTDFTGLEIDDTLQNLVIVPNSFNYSTGPDGTTCKRAGEQLNLKGNASRFRIFLKDLRKPNKTASPPENITVCSVTFQGIATAPASLSATYTFRNTAIARAVGPVVANLLGPYYQFILGSGVIDREEIPPIPAQ